MSVGHAVIKLYWGFTVLWTHSIIYVGFIASEKDGQGPTLCKGICKSFYYSFLAFSS